MRNPNVKILLIAIILIAAVTLLGLVITRSGYQLQPFSGSESPLSAQGAAAQAYLRVQVGNEVWDPIALAEGDEYTISQPGGAVNIVRTTATGAVMHSSTCDNQSCVQQGEVTLENRDSRVLSNMIICLPNQVILEVLTPEEAGMEAIQ